MVTWLHGTHMAQNFGFENGIWLVNLWPNELEPPYYIYYCANRTM